LILIFEKESLMALTNSASFTSNSSIYSTASCSCSRIFLPSSLPKIWKQLSLKKSLGYLVIQRYLRKAWVIRYGLLEPRKKLSFAKFWCVKGFGYLVIQRYLKLNKNYLV
jgi:hypothetical protein